MSIRRSKGCRALRLENLGSRICILGPSNSGKSTLASAIGNRFDVPVVHLDQLYHKLESDWEPRPVKEFIALHDAAILRDHWVIDGNYSRCLPQRLSRATGLILLDVSTLNSLLRYFRRTLFERGSRIGALGGDRDTLKWSMVHHIVVPTRINRKQYAEIFRHTALPKISLMSARNIAQFYHAEKLRRPGK